MDIYSYMLFDKWNYNIYNRLYENYSTLVHMYNTTLYVGLTNEMLVWKEYWDV